MRAKALLFFFLFKGGLAMAQGGSYVANTIPAALKKNASKVIRFEHIDFEVTDIDHARMNVHRIVTVLDKEGSSALFFQQITDKFISLEGIEIKIYDSTGKNIRSYKQKDLLVAAYGGDILDDSKVVVFAGEAASFPVTVEYNYELRYKGLIVYPPYRILKLDEGVESSSYTAKVKKEMDLRYKEKNIVLPPVVTEDGKYKSYTWSVKNLVALAEEDSAHIEDRLPSILLAPNRFQLDSYEGDMSSWNGFGKWYADLQKGTDELPEERKSFFRALVKDVKGDREKVRVIYSYLQQNFRYVAIEFGIGGYKPLPAEFTDKKKYGDCKGLSNYVQTALAAVGIKSYQALINAGYRSEPVDPLFPCNLFNHDILCVPLPGDSVWLECTSRSSEFGELGNFTENRNALLITEHGGVLVATPKSRSAENRFSAFTRIELKEDGSGKTATVLKTTGAYKQDLIGLADEKSDDRKDYTIERLGFKDPDEIIFPAKPAPGDYELVVNQEMESVPQAKTGNKMFLPTRIYRLWAGELPSAKDRHEDFYFGCPFEKTDTTIFHIPDGYMPDAMPEPRNDKCAIATYTTRYWYDEKAHEVHSTARIVLTQYKIPVKDYAAIKDFFDAIFQDGSEAIVIKRQDGGVGN